MKKELVVGSVEAGFFEVLHRDGLFVAQNPIPRPIEPCRLNILNVDAFEGEEILIAWNYFPDIKGMTIYSIPEMVK